MTTRLDELLAVTKQLNELLSISVAPDNRDELIKQTNQLIEKRETYMKNVEPPFTEEEIQIGKQIIDMNTFIQKRMDQLFFALKKEMKQIKQKKQSNRRYIKPYKNAQTFDGIFLDKKQ